MWEMLAQSKGGGGGGGAERCLMMTADHPPTPFAQPVPVCASSSTTAAAFGGSEAAFPAAAHLSSTDHFVAMFHPPSPVFSSLSPSPSLVPPPPPPPCHCVVKEGAIGEYVVRLSLMPASAGCGEETPGYPLLRLDISRGESHVLSHMITLKPTSQVGITCPDSPNELNGHPSNKKRKRVESPTECLGEGVPSATATIATAFAKAHKQQQHKRKRKKKCKKRPKTTGGAKSKKQQPPKELPSKEPAKERDMKEHIEHKQPIAAVEKGETPGALVLRDAPKASSASPSEDVWTAEDAGILCLPAELLELIFIHLPVKEIASLNRVCKRWEAVVDNNPFWRHIFGRMFGIPPLLRYSWKQRTLACARRAQIYELDLEGSMYGQLSWASQFGYYQYFQDTVKKYVHNTKSPLKSKIDGDLMRFAATEGFGEIIGSIMATNDVTLLRDTMRRTGLHHATKYGKLEVAKMLIVHNPALLEDKDKYGDTPLILAACYGNTTVVELLLAHGAKVDGKNQDEYTPLIFAAQNGHTDIVDILLQNGADVNARGNEGTSPLIIASQEGHTDVVRLLLAHQPDLNARVTASGDTALILALSYDHDAIVDLLLQHGADPNVQTVHGKTAVFFAALHGKRSILEKLVASGGDINQLTPERASPLLAAAKGGHADVVDFLLRQGAAVDVSDNLGNTALMLAVWQENIEVVKLLLPYLQEQEEGSEAISSDGEKGKEKQRPIDEGEGEEEEAFQLVVSQRPDNDDESETGLVLDDGMVVDKGDEDDEGDDDDAVGGLEHSEGEPEKDDAEKNLLEYRDRNGNTALMLAVRKKNLELVKMLLDCGAPVKPDSLVQACAGVIGATTVTGANEGANDDGGTLMDAEGDK